MLAHLNVAAAHPAVMFVSPSDQSASALTSDLCSLATQVRFIHTGNMGRITASRNVSREAFDKHACGACRLDLARLEGLGMSFMCSHLVEVRQAALDVLFTARELHGKLLLAGARSNPVTPAPPASNSPTPGTHTCPRSCAFAPSGT